MTLDAFIPSDYQKAMAQSMKETEDAWNQGANMDAGSVARLTSIKRNYHWLSSGSALGLAQSGYNGYSPEVQQAAQLDLRRQLRDFHFNKLMTKDGAGLAHQLQNMSSAEFNSYTPEQRKQLKQQVVEGTLNNDTPLDALGHAASDLSYSFGRATKGDIPGAVFGPSQETRTNYDQDVPGVKPVVREAAVVAGTGYESLSGMIRNEIGGGNPLFSKGGQDVSQQTTLGQQVVRSAQGEDASLGKGFLPDPESAPVQAAHQVQLHAAPKIDGHAATLGRWAANKIFEPGTLPFNAVSGVIDATTAIKGDPTVNVLNQFSEARAANKFFSPTVASKPSFASGTDMLDTALRDAGHEFTTARYGVKASELDKLAENAPGEYLDTIEKLHGPDISSTVAMDMAGRAHNDAAYQLAKDMGLNLGDSGTFTGPTAEAWSNSPLAQDTFANLAEEPSPYKVWLRSNKKFDLATSKAFAESTTAQEAQQVFLDHVNTPGLNGPFRVESPNNLSYTFKKGFDNSALGGMLPDIQYLQPANGEETLKALNAIRQESHISVEQASDIMDEFIKNTGSIIPGAEMDSRLRAIKAMSGLIKERMVNVGTDPEVADQLTNFMNISAKKSFEYTDQLIADQQALTGPSGEPLSMMLGGEAYPLPDPKLTAQWGNDAMEIPLARDLRNATSKAAPLLNSPLYRATSTGLDFFMSTIWKPLHLLRPELGLRILLDSQASLAANGYDSLFTHPIRYIGMMVGQPDDGILARLLAKGVAPTYVTDGLGAPLIDAGNSPLMHELYGGLDNINPVRAAMKGKRLVPITDALAPKGLAESISQLNGDRVVRSVLDHNTPAEAKAWFWDGEGKAVRESLIKPTQRISNASIAYDTLGNSPIHIDLTSQTGSDAFIQSIYGKISEATGNHPDLIDSVHSGEINGVPLWKNNKINRHAVNQMEALINSEMANPTSPAGVGNISNWAENGGRQYFSNDPEIAGLSSYSSSNAGDFARGHPITPLEMPAKPMLPEQVAAQIPLSRSKAAQQRYFSDRAMEAMFNAVLTTPDVKVDRIPAYAQTLWGSVNKPGTIERIAPYLSVGDFKTLLDNAEEANLPNEVMNRLRGVAGKIDTTAERVPLHIAMDQASHEAMDNIINLVHDLHSRSQFGDMTRILFPFGDAFRRVATRWASTVWDNPQVLRRIQQGFTEAQSSGFFHKDPQTGAYTFTYPGSDWLTDKLIGVPVPLQGQVKGLSMIGEGVPGVGPAISVPAQWLLPDTPQYDGIRKLIFPSGAPDPAHSPIEDLTGSIEPAWFSKIVTGPPDQKAMNDTVGAMAKYLASTGRYNLHGANAVQETSRMLADAKDKARLFYIVRGVAQSFSPTAPAPVYQIKDKTGRLQVLNVVRTDYYKYSKAHGPAAAMNWLIQRYGPDNMFLAQPTSAPIGYAVPVTKQGQNWARENKDVKGKYPSTYGFFAPSSPKDKFDITAYEDQFNTGERKSLTPQEQSDLANTRVGLYLYHRTRDKFIQANAGDPLDSSQTEMLALYKKHLEQQYPGFGLVQYDTTRLPRAIKELTAASLDPKLKGSDAGQGLTLYLEARKKAQVLAEAQDLSSPFKASSAQWIRDYLRAQATTITQKHPSFLPMWEQIWSHEMTQDPGELASQTQGATN